MQLFRFSRKAHVNSKLLAAALTLLVNLTPVAPVFAALPPQPTLANPDIFTDTAQPHINGSTGAFTQSYSLDIPPGRNGLQPDVTLDYSSQRTQDSIVGYGWQLSIPFIQRLNKTGSQDLYGNMPYFTSSIDGELTNVTVTATTSGATSTPYILDTLPLTIYQTPVESSDSRTYAVPAGGTNKLFLVLLTNDNTTAPSATLNGSPLTFVRISGSSNEAWYFIGYLANPTSGTFTMNWNPSTEADYTLLTVANAAQVNPIDATAVTTVGPGTICTTTLTTTQGNDLLLSFPDYGTADPSSTLGPGETRTITAQSVQFGNATGAYKNASSTAGTETMTTSVASTRYLDEPVVAIKNLIGGLFAAGTYSARVDNGSDNAYSFSNNTWTVYDKRGTRYLYGSSDSGRQYDTSTGTSTNTYKWYLQEVRDTNGNYIKYTYTRDSNQIYPNQIIYTGNGVTDGPATISFTTATRPDARISFAPGFKETTAYRISEIDALFNSQVVRKYLLGYGAGNNGFRSLLTSLQEQGYDDNQSLTSLPATTFSYTSATSSFLTQNGVSESSYVIADTNGNGVNDVSVMYSSTGSGPTGGLINGTQLGGATPDYWAGTSNTPYNNYPPWERGVRFVDVNADGKADVARGYYDNSAHTLSTELLINNYATSTNTYSWVSTSTASTSIPTFAYSAGGTTGIFGDLNGDGLSDFAQWLPGYVGQAAYLGTGAGWTPLTAQFLPPKDFSTPSPTASMLIDVNGDGLDDWVYSDGTDIYVLLNTGTGWESSPESQWTIATSTLYQSPDSSTTYYDRGIRFLDINGDGLPDFIRSYAGLGTMAATSTPRSEYSTTTAIFLNTGNGWATSTAYTLNPITAARLSNGTWSGAFQYNEYANFIGNGQMAQDVLATVTNSKGGRTSVTYTPSTQLGGNNELPYDVLVVTAIGTYDNLGNAATSTYTYSGGKQYFNLGTRDRKFAGFASSTATLLDSIIKTYFDQGTSVNPALGEQADGYPQINHLFRKDVLDLSSNLIQSNFYRWDSLLRGNGSSFVNLGRQVEQDYASDGTHRDKATDYTYSTSTDDLLVQDDYGEVAGASDGTFSDIGTDQRVTTMRYAASSSIDLSVPIEKATISSALVRVFVLGGGGGGGAGYTGNDGGAGGGAGGYLYDASHIVTPQAYTVTVGGGGTGGQSSGAAGQSGSNSSFDNLTAIGGGGGGSSTASPNGQNGGSGGGAAYNGTPGSGTTGQGNRGGGQDGNGGSTGGGGGASAAGGFGTSSGGGNGGDGISNAISGTLTYYAGGGGGGGNGGVGPGSGGSGGGGGGGAIGSAGSDATANTGGGGGGGTLSNGTWVYHAGGSGGSGIVIIAYPTGTITATGGTVTTGSGYTIHTFTSSGTWNVTNIASSQASATTTDSRFYYDNLPFGQVSLGNNTREEDWIATTTFASSTKTYNTYGLVATSTDRRGYATGYKYDTFNLCVATATNPLFQQTQYTCNYSNGKVKQTTDPNGRLFKNIYDGVGRLIETDQSDIATPSLLATSTTYQYTDNTTAPSIIHRADYLTATNTVDTYDYYDGLNRLVQERKASQTAGTYVATDRLYNGVGLLASTSLPYFSSGSGFTSPTTISALYTTYTYDPLKRVLITSNAAGSTNNTYAKWTTTTTDPNGHIKDYTLDAFGNLASVVEHIGVSLATTTYAYDAANDLATTTDSYGNVRAFFYDGLGRRLSAQDLHAPGHTPFGTWYYSYDDAGNATSQIDPKGSTTTRTYDALGRLLTETSAGTTQVTNTYDSCTYGIGYMCIASSTSAKTQNAYDILGRVTYATTTISGNGYTTGYTYDRQGNMSTLMYPNGSQVSYTYNLAGQLSSVQTKPSGGSWATIASNLTYAPQGVVTSALFGNGASSTWSFNPNVLYRLAALQTQGPASTTIQNFAYTYDPVGNLTQIANTASTTNSATVIYGYDFLNRLTSASTTAASSTPYIQYFAYDNLGNLLSVSNGATTSPGTIMPTIIASSTDRFPGQSTSDSFAFNAGATSSNTVLLVMFEGPSGAPTSATYNGQSLTLHTWAGLSSYDADGYLVNPAPGTHTFTINYPSQANPQYRVFVLNNVDQTTPFDVDGEATAYPAGTCPKTLSTTVANDLLVADTIGNSQINPITEGTGQTELWQTQPYGAGLQWWAGATKPATSTGSQTMSFTFNTSSSGCDEVMVALKAAAVSAPIAATTTVYAYPQTGYMNPDALGSLGNGISTTTYSYDANGNLIQAGGWSYVWDYLNRMLASGYANSTTTYAYDPSGARVLQTSTTSTTYYPSKYYSFTSTKSGANTYATSTNYVWNGDTLLATVDQPMFNGTATGTPITRYIHPDHLGSTNAVTDQNGNLVQLLDYYPFGATRVSTSTYPTSEKRDYIGQFFDPATNLNYLNARFYDSSRGQFVNEDPVFWGKQNIADPQSLDAYSYAEGNPIVRKDPTGLYSLWQVASGQATWDQWWGDVDAGTVVMGQDSHWDYAMNHPYSTGALIGALSYPVAASGGSAISAYNMATYAGVGSTFAAQQGFAAAVYASLTTAGVFGLPTLVNTVTSTNLNSFSSVANTAFTVGAHMGPTIVGGYVGAIDDAWQFSKLVVDTIGSSASYLYSSSVQSRISATKTFNSSLGSSSSGGGSNSGGSVGGGGGNSSPSPNSMWVTPSGAVVTFSGHLVSLPPTSK